ncbi:MAG: AAA family ATPase [Candidatus Heimdallarchaeaceae archaeon]
MQNYEYKNAMDELKTLMKARVPLMWVKTFEENRFLEEFYSLATEVKKDVKSWSSTLGIVPILEHRNGVTASGSFAKTEMPIAALRKVMSYDTPDTVFIFKDFNDRFVAPLPRMFRDMKMLLKQRRQSVIILSPSVSYGQQGETQGLPPTLEKEFAIIDYRLPNRAEIKVMVTTLFEQNRNKLAGKLSIPNPNKDEEIDPIVDAVLGLTQEEIENSLSTSLVYLKEINIKRLLSNKRNLIKKSNLLTFIETDLDAKDIGGLENLKEYLFTYRDMHSKAAREFGVTPLKGVLITGVPGCGKSLTAKVTGNIWNKPVLLLDIGKVMSSLVGSSEEKMRQAIETANLIAPCILFIDEVEKSLSGTKSSGSTDGGTLSRVFGTLLTAMEEDLKDVTVIATANNIENLPPEFIRRFNEVFFVDLPSDSDRWEIFKIHLEKKGRKIEDFEKDRVALLKASQGFTGAEIEKAIEGALAMAFNAKSEDLTVEYLLKSIEESKPISEIQGEKIEEMRRIAKSHYRFAGRTGEEQTEKEEVKSGTIGMSQSLNIFSE